MPAKNTKIPLGTVFGHRTVIGVQDDRSSNGSFLYEVQCQCGRIAVLTRTSLRKTKACQNCSSKESAISRGPLQSLKAMTGGIHNDYLHRLTFLASYRNRAFEVAITIEDLSSQWSFQNGRCALSGRPLILKANKRDRSGTASVDRIDSSRGYFPDNFQWVHKDVNQMKMDLPEKYFFDMCRDIVDHKGVTKRLREGRRPWLKSA